MARKKRDDPNLYSVNEYIAGQLGCDRKSLDQRHLDRFETLVCSQYWAARDAPLSFQRRLAEEDGHQKTDSIDWPFLFVLEPKAYLNSSGVDAVKCIRRLRKECVLGENREDGEEFMVVTGTKNSKGTYVGVGILRCEGLSVDRFQGECILVSDGPLVYWVGRPFDLFKLLVSCGRINTWKEDYAEA